MCEYERVVRKSLINICESNIWEPEVQNYDPIILISIVISFTVIKISPFPNFSFQLNSHIANSKLIFFFLKSMKFL